jgi:hypothetical protein
MAKERSGYDPATQAALDRIRGQRDPAGGRSKSAEAFLRAGMIVEELLEGRKREVASEVQVDERSDDDLPVRVRGVGDDHPKDSTAEYDPEHFPDDEDDRADDE